ncbi:MAG: hypothetical protein N2Z58_06625 [Fervidobacterium sp.]|nr:hypothetical protein [Fervidobacterium sp.]
MRVQIPPSAPDEKSVGRNYRPGFFVVAAVKNLLKIIIFGDESVVKDWTKYFFILIH